MKLQASEVQKMLVRADGDPVRDGDVIAHGYTFERRTIDIFFKEGSLVRSVSDGVGTEIVRVESKEFEIEFFFNDIKRFYDDGRTNESLKNLLETFGRPLSLTPGVARFRDGVEVE